MRLLVKNEPELITVSQPVSEGSDVSELLESMWKIMKDWRCPDDEKIRGVGLAANQVGVCQRVFIMDVRGITQVFINPVIVKKSPAKTISVETCMSCPGVRLAVKRPKQVTITGYDQYWKPIKYKLRGISAACVQHEIDHLDGITLRSRMATLEHV